MREQWVGEQRTGVASGRLARVLTAPAAPDGAAGGSGGKLPAITLRHPVGGWRPYRPGAADPAEAGLVPPRGAAVSEPPERPAAAGPGGAPAAADREAAEGAAGAAEPPDGAGGRWGRLAGHAFDPGRPGLRALAAVAVAVALGAGVLAWWSRPQPEPVLPYLPSASAAPGPTEPAVLVVAVTGQVREPGLVELPAGARVADAIEAAGGLLPEAEIDHLNLARKVSDGELIAVGVEPPPGDPAGSPGAGSTGGKVNLNTGTLEELQTLPGIGPALAQRIVDYRTEHGPFTAVSQLRQVSGIGEVRFAELRDLVTV